MRLLYYIYYASFLSSFIPSSFLFFFFFNDTATTEIYTLSLHDALPILPSETAELMAANRSRFKPRSSLAASTTDRKSTRLNSSHRTISYAVFCLKKKKNKKKKKKK